MNWRQNPAGILLQMKILEGELINQPKYTALRHYLTFGAHPIFSRFALPCLDFSSHLQPYP